jgi:hypothetical protein
MKLRLTVIVIICVFAAMPQLRAADEKPETKPLNQSDQITKEYLDSFEQTGVPTPGAVTAAFQKAKDSPSIENWQLAAKSANTYANAVDILTQHYSRLYEASTSGGGTAEKKYISAAVVYERTRNKYMTMRNDAYLEIAKLFLEQGDKAKALSFAAAAVRLSALEPNVTGEQLIRSIIEFEK